MGGFGTPIGDSSAADGPDIGTGIIVYDPDTGEQLGVLKYSTSLTLGSRRGLGSGADLPAGLFLTTTQGQRIPFPYGGTFVTGSNRALDISGNGQIIGSRALSFGGGGSSGPTYEEELGLLRERARLDEEQNRAQREFQQQENERDRAATLRRQRLSDLLNLTQTLASVQESAKQKAIDLIGKDPFRAAAMLQGQAPLGISPVEKFQGELRGLAGAQIPSVSDSAEMPQIEQAISQTTGLINNAPRKPLGLKHGGVVEPEGGKGLNRVGTAVLVGKNDDEVAEFLPDGRVRFIPLVAKAQFGLSVQTEGGGHTPYTAGGQPPQSGNPPLSTALGTVQPLTPLYRAIGATAIPLGTRLPAAYGGMLEAPSFGTGVGYPSPPMPGFAGETFRNLGTIPRLIYDPELDSFFSVGSDNQVRVIGGSQRLLELGYNPTFATIMPVRELTESMGLYDQPGLGLQGAKQPYDMGPLQQELRNPRPNAFGPLSPLFSPLNEAQTVGAYLPDPMRVANEWRFLDPDTRRLIISAYGLAGLSEEQIGRRLDFATPTGRAGLSGAPILG